MRRRSPRIIACRRNTRPSWAGGSRASCTMGSHAAAWVGRGSTSGQRPAPVPRNCAPNCVPPARAARCCGIETQAQHLRVTALLLQRRRSPLRAFEHGLRLHHVDREAGDEVDEAEHGEQEQGRRRRPRHEHELAGHGDEQDEREQMVDEALAAGPHRFEDLDVEQEYADRDDKIAHGDRDAVVEDQWQGRLGGERELEYRAFLLIAERHVEEKNDDVEERRRDEQQGESDQVHDGWLSSRGRCRKNAKRGVRRDARSLEHVGANWNWVERRRQASFFDLRTCRPRYMPVLRSMWWGRRSSPESLSST